MRLRRRSIVACIAYLGLLALVSTRSAAEDSARPAKAADLAKASAVEGRLHGELVRSVSFTADGSRLVTASYDGTVGLWDASTFERRATVRTGKDAYWAKVTADGSFGVSGHEDGVVRWWNPKDGSVRRASAGHAVAVWGGALSSDGAHLATGGPDGRLVLWNGASGTSRRTMEHRATIGWMREAPDGATFAVASTDGAVTIYDAASGDVVRRLFDHETVLADVAFSADGSRLVTAGTDAIATVWRVSDGTKVRVLRHFAPVYAVACSPDGRWLATGGADYGVRLYDLETGIERTRFTGTQDVVWGLAWSPDGKRLACACADGRVLVWRPDSEPALVTERLPGHVDLRPLILARHLGVVAQHARSTCSLHTMTRAIEFALSKREARGVPLSDEYLNWACNQVIGNVGPGAVDRGQFFEHSWMGYCKHGICRRERMPWTERFEPGNAPSNAARADAEALRRVAFSWRILSSENQSEAATVLRVKAVLAAGWPVLAGSHHSLLVVGYLDDAKNRGGGRFFVEDSGTGGFLDVDTGDAFHSAIPYARVNDYGFSWVEAHEPYPVVGAAK